MTSSLTNPDTPADALLGIDRPPPSDSYSEAGTPPPSSNFHLFAPSHDRSSSPRKRQKREHTHEHGLEDDCPTFQGMDEYVKEVAGASLTAAKELRDGKADVAIAWTGGRSVGTRTTPPRRRELTHADHMQASRPAGRGSECIVSGILIWHDR